MSEWRMPASWLDGLCPIMNCGVRLVAGAHYCLRHSWTPDVEGDVEGPTPETLRYSDPPEEETE